MYSLRDVLVVIPAREAESAVAGLAFRLLEEGLAPSRLMLIDDASSDGSGERLRRRLPDSLHLQNEEPLGWAVGANRGLRHGLEYGLPLVAVLSPRLRPEPGMLAALVAVINQEGSLGLVAPEVRPEAAAGSPPPPLGVSWLRDRVRGGAPVEGAGPAPTALRLGMLLRARAIEEAGFLPEDLPGEWGPLELCVRLRAAGRRARRIPGARATVGPCEPGRQEDLDEWRGRGAYLRRAVPWDQWPEALLGMVLAAVGEAARRILRGRGESPWIPLAGSAGGLLSPP